MVIQENVKIAESFRNYTKVLVKTKTMKLTLKENFLKRCLIQDQIERKKKGTDVLQGIG